MHSAITEMISPASPRWIWRSLMIGPSSGAGASQVSVWLASASTSSTSMTHRYDEALSLVAIIAGPPEVVPPSVLLALQGNVQQRN